MVARIMPSWPSRWARPTTGPSVAAAAPFAPVPLILAHRGASALEPENSIAAFERAVADGADGVEMDVLLCATGEAVVFHDDDLTRLGGGHKQRIAALNLRDIRAIRLASGASIPTLEEALEACGPSLLVNVELKASCASYRTWSRLVARVAQVIDRTGTGDRVLVSSFHPGPLALWQQRARKIPFGLLFEAHPPWWRRGVLALPFLGAMSAHPEAELCTSTSMQRWHARGYRVYAWTVDDEAEIRRLRDLRIDGLITNDPARTRQTLQDTDSPAA